MSIISYPSANFDERQIGGKISAIEMLILHYTETKTTQEALDILVSAERKVSAHYVLAEDGQLFSLVDESKRAWHAGVSYWRGRENLNACSIGIEIVNPGITYGYRPFTKAQYNTLIPLAQRIKKQYGLKDIDIVAHSDVAPDRKKDPGELFDWKLLANNGVGLVTQTQSKIDAKNSMSLCISEPLNLKDLGYREHDTHSITAFQMHWRQNKVNGLWDEECGQTLTNLLGQI